MEAERGGKVNKPIGPRIIPQHELKIEKAYTMIRTRKHPAIFKLRVDDPGLRVSFN